MWRTCLHYAILNEHPNIITLLKENGADLDQKDCNGETPLRMGIRQGIHSSITTLVKLGASLEKANESSYHQDWFQDLFESSMKDEKTKAPIKEGQRLAGER